MLKCLQELERDGSVLEHQTFKLRGFGCEPHWHQVVSFSKTLTPVIVLINNKGPVVQNFVSLTSPLRPQLVK